MLVGEVVKPHGIRGEVIVSVLSDDPNRFVPEASLLVGPSADQAKPLQILATRPHQSRKIVAFAGASDRNAAEALRGHLIFVPPVSLKDPGEDAFWEHEIAGFDVYSVDGERLGSLSEVLQREEQDLWSVRTDSGDVLVPAVRDIVKLVDKTTRRIELDPPEGLFG